MVVRTADVDNPTVWLTAEEYAADFDRQVSSRLGMTGAEFLRDLDAGRWDDVIDDPDHRDVLYLALLIDLVRS